MWRKVMLIVMVTSVTADDGQKCQEFLFRDSFVILPGDRDRNNSVHGWLYIVRVQQGCILRANRCLKKKPRCKAYMNICVYVTANTTFLFALWGKHKATTVRLCRAC